MARIVLDIPDSKLSFFMELVKNLGFAKVAKDSPYDPVFVDKIENSRKQAAEGKTVKIDLDDIWK